MILQTQAHTLRPLTTAHLAQTMTLLELTGAELRQKIEAELASNPALEVMDNRRCPSCRRPLSTPGLCPICSRKSNSTCDEPIIFVSPYTDFIPRETEDTDEDYAEERWGASSEDLPSYVLQQIAPELVPEDRLLAAHILTSLDDDGLLTVPLIEIARYHHLPLSRINTVLRLIQRAEPVGVGSPSPQEALLVQIDVLSETRPVPLLATRAIQEAMDLLSRHAYNELGRTLGISSKEAQSVANFITDNLNPYPARAHWGDIRLGTEAANTYINPDIIISCSRDLPESPMVVEILSPFAGALRVNPLFRDALSQAPAEKMESWQAHLDRAALLVKCLQQRTHTMIRLMQRIVVLQRNYLLHGDAYLLPITRAQLAVELEVHESTISRAVSGKAVQLPNMRILPLSKFFDRSLHVRTALREIISSEIRPLSDTEIAEQLIQQGYPVARRTVAKYRAMEGILPARFRQSYTISNGP